MALAYLILAHKDPAQVELLFRTVHHPDDTFILHFDRRASPALHELADRLACAYPNVHVLRPRPVIWGGFSMPAVQLEAISEALRRNACWHHLITLSGQDFPLHPRDEVLSFLQRQLMASFLSWFDPLTTTHWNNASERINRYHLDWPWLHRLLSLPGLGRRLRSMLGWRGTFPHITGYRRRWPNFFHYYGGANHVAISRAAATYLTCDPSARRIIDWLRHAAHPDEITFQSVLLNSPLHDTLVNNDLRHIQFEKPSDPHPKTLTVADLPALRVSKAFWARKFDPQVDAGVIHELARRVQVPALP
jgi:hypothetical protein